MLGLIGGIIAGIALIGQHALLRKQQEEIEAFKKPVKEEEPVKEEQQVILDNVLPFDLGKLDGKRD